ncbi:MAG: efflux RND transporter permease subunit [Holosporales bacterium]|jgi:multidrug efflux pump|nr:efflux RND transporter permease subunit [Holosporales bacterium]
MKLSEVCINRPVFAWVLTLILVLLGLVTGDRLPVRQYPKMEKNHVTVKMTYVGAGPEIVENLLTRVIEEAIAGIEGIETIESKSDNEVSEVSIEIAEGRDLDSATNDIRDRLSKWRDRFPDAAQEPILTKAGSNEKSIMSLAMISEKLTESELFVYATNEISHALEAVPGVARVDVYGAGDHQMTISLDPQRMAFYNLTVIDVINALKRQNVESPAGKIVNKDREYVVTMVADIQSAEEFDEIPIISKKHSIVKLKDIGKAKLDKSNKRVLSRFNGEKMVSLAIISQTSANPIQVAREVKIKYEELKKQIPENISFSIAYDSTTFIERSLHEVYSTILESILLVVLVVFVFLRSFKAALIPLITVPISLIGSLFIMYLCNFSLNNMTLMSMVLAIGLVVDDAIVILENIYKHIEKKKSAMRAAIDGTKEVSFAVIAMTLTLCAVYAPVALAQGITGKYLKEFSITLAGAVFLSGFVALTLSPMMCSRTLTGHGKKSKSKFMTMITKFISKFDASDSINALESWYSTALDKVLERKRFAITLAILFSAFGYFVFCFMPSEQMPYQDMRYFSYDGHAPQTATLDFTQRYVDAIDKVVGTAEEVESRQYTITNPAFEGVAILKDEGGRSTDEILEEIIEKSGAVSGIDVRFSSGRGGMDDSSKVVMFVVRGNKSHRELREITGSLSSELYASGIVRSVRSTAKNEAEDYIIEVNRDKASSMNVEPRIIADTIAGLIQGTVATKFKKDNKVYDAKVEIEEGRKRSPDQLNDIYIKTYLEREELLLPVAELINVYARSGPVSIHRYNRTRANTVIPILNDSTSLGEAIDIIRDIAHRVLPDDVFIEFIGETKRYLTESNTMFLIFMLALSFIYLVMAAQFESWKDPFIIMLTVPLTLVGGIMTLACIKNGTINMFSNIGFLTLIGLITKHGILIVDFANKLVDQGSTPLEAVKRAALMRLRPILMTTFAMVLGAVPLAFARGAGCEIRVPLGAVIAGGMTIGTLFTIFIVPVVYVYMSGSRSGKKKRKVRLPSIKKEVVS